MTELFVFNSDLILIAAKYLTACGALGGVALAPAWLAEKNEKNRFVVARVRASSWLFGWTAVGYFYGLYLAVKPEKKE
jgi:hypothetical protein